MHVIIRQPKDEQEWQQYFDCRWLILRKPWLQKQGSEKDELEKKSIHRSAIIDQKVIAVGRLHFIDKDSAQIRYMAVLPEFQHQGIGYEILKSLELAATKKNIKTITLNARESAIKFYEKHHYINIKPSHTLYGTIKHVQMSKSI